jgi:hypothetical protein
MGKSKKKKRFILRLEHKIFLFIIGAVVVLYFLFYFLLPSIFLDFLAKFIAGFMGILIGFGLDRQIELWKRIRASKQIINSFVNELKRNRAFCEKYRNLVIAPAQGNTVENFFDLFQTSTWDMFCSRLEMEDINIQYKLGELYHKLQLFNLATINNNDIQRTLGILLERDPKFLLDLEQELGSLVKALENELGELP